MRAGEICDFLPGRPPYVNYRYSSAFRCPARALCASGTRLAPTETECRPRCIRSGIPSLQAPGCGNRGLCAYGCGKEAKGQAAAFLYDPGKIFLADGWEVRYTVLTFQIICPVFSGQLPCDS